MDRVRNFLALLRTRLWVVPALMCVAGLALAYVMLGPWRSWVDFSGSQLWWLYSGDAGSARNLLGALLSGTMTMTSLVVSLTFVTLTLAANQLGPRLIVNFIADREIQAVLGFFLATILYLIAIMRTIGDELGPDTVPHLAITFGSILTIFCMFAMLFYVHKVSRAIIADNVIEHVYRDLRKQISDAFPERNETREAKAPTRTSANSGDKTRQVGLEKAGYVQTIDYDALASWAAEHKAVVTIHVQAGDFVLRGGEHLAIDAPDGVEPDALDAMRRLIVIGPERSPAQDLDYSVRQLVELALRALSPGINDPFTAVATIDWLGAAMEIVLARPPIPTQHFDEAGELRLISRRPNAETLANACFDDIRQAAAQNTAVLMHLTDTLGKLAAGCRSQGGLRVIASHLDKVEAMPEIASVSQQDRESLQKRIEAARRGAPVSRNCPPD